MEHTTTRRWTCSNEKSTADIWPINGAMIGLTQESEWTGSCSNLPFTDNFQWHTGHKWGKQYSWTKKEARMG